MLLVFVHSDEGLLPETSASLCFPRQLASLDQRSVYTIGHSTEIPQPHFFPNFPPDYGAVPHPSPPPPKMLPSQVALHPDNLISLSHSAQLNPSHPGTLTLNQPQILLMHEMF